MLTAAHVIEGCTGFAVVLPDQRRLRARIVGLDPVGDMALLRVPLRGRRSCGSGRILQTGETVEHHGFPHGARQTGRTVRSAGAGLQGPRNEPDSMALRGEIRSGDNGAGVFDAWENLVGMAYGGKNMAWYAVRVGRIADFLLLHWVPVAASAPAYLAPLGSAAARGLRRPRHARPRLSRRISSGAPARALPVGTRHLIFSSGPDAPPRPRQAGAAQPPLRHSAGCAGHPPLSPPDPLSPLTVRGATAISDPSETRGQAPRRRETPWRPPLPPSCPSPTGTSSARWVR